MVYSILWNNGTTMMVKITFDDGVVANQEILTPTDGTDLDTFAKNYATKYDADRTLALATDGVVS